MYTIDYSTRLSRLKNRRTDVSIILKSIEQRDQYKYLTESYEQLVENDLYKYVVGAMKPVDDIYTKNTYKEGERIKNQLDKIKTPLLGFDYRYQGSVTNNTHIKAHSDIDVLVIIDKFTTIESPQVVTNPYRGNPVDDLVELRELCFEHLNKSFPEAIVDNSGAKSIAVEGGSLRRKIDVVPSNWYDTNEYKEKQDETYRGIYILDYKKKTRYPNTPFKHNKLLEIKDNNTQGKFKMIVRLLKTLKADADEEINFSSYDIAALMYCMPDRDYNLSFNEILLMKNSIVYIEYILKNNNERISLDVPDCSRKIFDKDDEKVKELKKLLKELKLVCTDLESSMLNEGISIYNKKFY